MPILTSKLICVINWNNQYYIAYVNDVNEEKLTGIYSYVCSV